METKFTSGEWIATAVPKSTGMCSTIHHHFEIETEELHGFVRVESESREESEANANLIAAAPSMYAMIEQMASLRDNNMTDAIDWIIDNTDDLIELLEKARGE